uniref:ATP synthase complex subunit 8 n=1 Tax=Rasboroides vaterifloris TaxID=244134 RepID=F3Y752_9TELE|nr:ATP synthase F0 subunit 8 [Rasboroides vaterifloris]BAK23203.1 ATPase subunit 8 [Rasboroides vaterifloris]
MPQLNPLPWFTILVFSWAVLLVMTKTKIMNYTQPNEFVLLDIKKYQNPNWTWSW